MFPKVFKNRRAACYVVSLLFSGVKSTILEKIHNDKDDKVKMCSQRNSTIKNQERRIHKRV